MKIERKGREVVCTFTLAEAPYVSKSEAAKAVKAQREPIARALYDSGGFVLGEGLKLSLNVIKA